MRQWNVLGFVRPLLVVLSLMTGLAIAGRAADPGTELPATSEISDQKLGSVLIYPLALSGAAANQENTRFSITNHSLTSAAFIRLLFINGVNGAVTDTFICLTAGQTATFLHSDVDPGVRGFLVGISIDGVTGVPNNLNQLFGEASVKLAGGHQAGYKAEAIAAVAANPASVNGSNATLAFDGTSYNRLPRALAVDRLKSTADGNSTILALCRVDGNYNVALGSLGAITGTMFNDAAQAAPFTLTGATQEFITLSDAFPITPVYSQLISAGRSGWLQIWRDADAPLIGATLNFNAGTGSNGSRFNGGHNLRKLTLTAAGSITVSILAPPC
ncbi:MAG TPA: hypothetical protein PLD20_30200 [Blastocatellia bacterium]|nr:hypothetical protein [Blastocatellia bacterium]HMV84795.1 hypothetical protein [Blastocatellia bacterium]HMX28470.1 hypothetical protein [Blastocatellia bacterium]HMY74154.1 hypothetical protein [Blastocatellia bacterium]HMZ22242.1 hypothetical protein [Blastocatellia bacterium]